MDRSERPTASWLFERLQEFAGETALVFRDQPTSYEALLDRVRFWEGELQRRSLGAGSVVLVEGGFSPNAVGLLLALIRAGAIAVPLTPLSHVHKEEFAELAEVGGAFEFAPDDSWTVTVHDRPVTNPLLKRLVEQGRPGLVIFSSGSTGRPKAVLHDFGGLLAKFQRRGVRKTTLSFLLFDHIGGVDTLMGTLANCGTLVTPPTREPEVVCRTIAAHRVHTLPTSPTFLNLLLISGCWRNHDLSSLQVVAYGSEPMPEALLGRLREALPKTTFVQTYGMSELGVLRTRAKDTGSLWMKFSGEGFETKVVNGTLRVRTPTAMLGYLNAPDLIDEEGWLDTEDAVEIDGDYLRILGRASDLVNVGGQKVYPAEVENVVLAMDNVREVCVYGEPSPLLGTILAARVSLVAPEPFEDFKKRLRAHCRERLPSYKVPARLELTERDQFGTRLKKMRSRPSGERESGA